MLFQYRVITDQIYTSISQKNCPKHFGYLKEVNRNFIIILSLQPDGVKLWYFKLGIFEVYAIG